MKKWLGVIQDISVIGHIINCICENGNLKISISKTEVINFEYCINGYKTPQFLDEASSYLIQYPKENYNAELVQDENYWYITVSTIRIVLEKKGSNIAVFYNGILVHGGRAGGKDTVIPQNQFRLLGDFGSEYGRFNFPLNDEDAFFGLGDKAGSPDHRGKRVRMYNKDSLGYDGEYSDPLYKSVPFFLKINRTAGTSIGVFFPESSIKSFDLGKESPFYYSVDVLGGPFRYSLILGDEYKQIIRTYCTLSGKPALPPLYSFGFFGSSMNYVETWDAQKRMLDFFEDVQKRELPCEGMYVSSGYLKADDGHRYSFFWNKRKFPDPKSLIENLKSRGYHLTFNIKPGILKTHPWYDELRLKDYFIKDNDGNPVVEYFWGGDASFIDFNNPDAKSWWKEKLNQAYLSFGVEGIWNDNNECEIEDDRIGVSRVSTLYPIKMCEAAWEACIEKNPNLRPWIYSRSGYAGLQKYARTWTGDNTSTFKTLKFNQFQAVSLGISGIPYVGHDLGGFFGPEPSPELLVRCCQSAIFQCRFVIHSWRDNDEPTEPWKFPSVYHIIKDALIDHYLHMPYIYNCAYHATSGAPIERLLMLEYPEDKHISANDQEYMFGDSVLKAPVVNENQFEKFVYFPERDDWYSPRSKVLFHGGESKTFKTPLDTTWYFYKAGSIIPKIIEASKLKTGFFNSLQMNIFPKNGVFEFEYFEDDGQSILTDNSHNIWNFKTTYDFVSKTGVVDVKCNHCGNISTIEGRTWTVVFPEGFVGKADLKMSESDGTQIRFSGEYK